MGAAKVDAAWRRLQGFVAVVIGLSLLVVGRQLWATDSGFDEVLRQGHRIVVAVDPGGPAARAGITPGDEILWDPGLVTYREPWSEREIYAWNWRLGDAQRAGSVPMRLRRDGVERTTDVITGGPTLSATLRQLRVAGPTLPTAFAFLVAAALLARRSVRDDKARRTLAYGFALLGPCYTINTPSISWPHWMIVASAIVLNVGSIGGATAICSFAWSFPTRVRASELVWLKVAVVALGAIAATIPLLDVAGVIRFPLPGNQAEYVWNVLLVVATIAALVWQRRRAAAGVARRQASLLLAAVVVGYSAPILGTLLPSMLGLASGGSSIAYFVTFPLSLLLPLGFASAVARYRLFDLDGAAPRAGFHAMVVGTSLLIYVLVASAVARALAPLGTGGEEAGRIVAIGAVLALGEPLRAVTKRTIDRLFERDREALLAGCATLSARLAGVGEPVAIEATVRDVLGSTTARLFVTDSLPSAQRDAVLREVTRRGAMRVVHLAEPAAVDTFLALDIDTLVSVRAGADDARALGLSSQLGRDPADRTEREALANVGRVIGASLAQHAARSALEAKVSRGDAERKRIAMDLHDGVGATLTSARLMTQLARTSHEREVALDALEATLQEGLSDLRMALWSLDEKELGWSPLFARLRRHCADLCSGASLAFEMHADVGDADDPSPAVRVTVLRVVQEAVTNVARHARATSLTVRVTSVGDELSLAIEDDGVGLAEPRGEGRGLGNMRRRLEELGGTVAFEAREGGGTRVLGLVPIPRSPRADVAAARAASTITSRLSGAASRGDNA